MNIFAETLVDVLAAHDKELSNLYNFKNDIPPSTVVRIKDSLTLAKTATLNSAQLAFLQSKYDFIDEEMRLLHAALVAEAVRHLLADRGLGTHTAYRLGKLALQVFISDDPEQMQDACEALLQDMRHMPAPVAATAVQRGDLTIRGAEPTGAADDAISRALEGAYDLLHAGLLWLEVARAADQRRARLGYLALAHDLLSQAQDLAQHPPSVALASPEQAELQQSIGDALQEVTFLR